jgi:hypothetical protein
MTPRQFDLFAPPVIERAATISTGAMFEHAGRTLRVYRTYGTDARAPVIVEELGEFGSTLRGQFALWSVDAVKRAIDRQSRRALPWLK